MGDKAARITDLCSHTVTAVISGSPDTIVGCRLAARTGDLTSPCPVCKIPKPGKIVKGSSTVFINKKSAARVSDKVMCGAGAVPPVGGHHKPVKEYSVRPEDNYIEAVFSDDKYLITESESKDGAAVPDKPPKKKPASFFRDLSLDIDLGSKVGNASMGFGPNSVSTGESTVIIGG